MRLEEIQVQSESLEIEVIDVKFLLEDYFPVDYRVPIGHLPMLRGHFEPNYDP